MPRGSSNGARPGVMQPFLLRAGMRDVALSLRNGRCDAEQLSNNNDARPSVTQPFPLRAGMHDVALSLRDDRCNAGQLKRFGMGDALGMSHGQN
ncbi:hypothetical protein HAX54_017987 [Datura stramonium]|uniref:Uncharacterized protein n=1 Tax=Datura stramonium TaxID=4076 RepID=A0ABS8UM84_DATST|nr:hypothetical protein [Datura stramonium]